MDRFADLCVASLACTNSVNYIFRENSRKINHKFYKVKDGITILRKIYLSKCYLYLLLYRTQAPFSTRVLIFSLSYRKHAEKLWQK